MLDSCKMVEAVWSIPYVSVAFSLSLKQNFIAYRSSKVSDCISEIYQPWQSGFCRVYSNSYCSCSFEAEIIKIGRSSHKMYSNFQVYKYMYSILNAHTKKVWKLIVCPSYIYSNSLLVTLFLNETKLIYLHTVNSFQLLRTQIILNGLYCYLIWIFPLYINLLFAHC